MPKIRIPAQAKPRHWEDFDPETNTFLDVDAGVRVTPEGRPVPSTVRIAPQAAERPKTADEGYEPISMPPVRRTPVVIGEGDIGEEPFRPRIPRSSRPTSYSLTPDQYRTITEGQPQQGPWMTGGRPGPQIGAPDTEADKMWTSPLIDDVLGAPQYPQSRPPIRAVPGFKETEAGLGRYGLGAIEYGVGAVGAGAQAGAGLARAVGASPFSSQEDPTGEIARKEIGRIVKAKNPRTASEALSSILNAAQEYQTTRPELMQGQKAVEEFLFDPLNLIGIGLEPRIARGVSALAKAGGRTVRQIAEEAGPAIGRTARELAKSERGAIDFGQGAPKYITQADVAYEMDVLSKRIDDLSASGEDITDDLTKLDELQQLHDHPSLLAQVNRISGAEDLARADAERGMKFDSAYQPELRNSPLSPFTELLNRTKGKMPETFSVDEFKKWNSGRAPKTVRNPGAKPKDQRVDAFLVIDDMAKTAGYDDTDAFTRDLEQLWAAKRQSGVPTTRPVTRQRKPKMEIVQDAPSIPMPKVGTPEYIRAYKSPGHLGIINDYEYYKDAKGDLWKASLTSVADVRTGYRQGRWEAPAHMADAYWENIQKSVAEPPTASTVTPPSQIGQIQSGMGIGEPGRQGALLDEFGDLTVGKTEAAAIQKAAQDARDAARINREAELARGQGDMLGEGAAKQRVKIARQFDSFKATNAPKESYVDARGEDRTRYAANAYTPDYMTKSSVTGRHLRWVYQLEDGRAVSFETYMELKTGSRPASSSGKAGFQNLWNKLSSPEQQDLFNKLPLSEILPPTEWTGETTKGAPEAFARWLRDNQHPMVNVGLDQRIFDLLSDRRRAAMPFADYFRGQRAPYGRDKVSMADEFRAVHKGAVQRTLERGETVPPEVLKDYPDLSPSLEGQATPNDLIPPTETPIPPATERPTSTLPSAEKVAEDTARIEERTIEAIQSGDANTLDEGFRDALLKDSGDNGLPPPMDPPALANSGGGSKGRNPANKGGKGPEDNDPAGNLYAVIHGIPGENNGRAALRKWDGARNVAALEVKQWWNSGNKLLRGIKGGRLEDGGLPVTRDTDMEGLFKALHGEGAVPPKMQSVYDDLKKMVDQETSDMLAADRNFTRMILAHPDYFPRLWRAPKVTEPGARGIGTKPGFLKPRVDATFTELLEAGYEPVSWNPYDMMALRRIAGVEYRESRELVKKLKAWDSALPAHEAPKDGWRVPEVGPAFEGRAFALPEGAGVGYTERYAVPNQIADVLENLYGKAPTMSVAGKNVLPILRHFGGGAKRAKLFGSFFQHIDFTQRVGFVSATPTALMRGSLTKYPTLVGRLAKVSLSKASREDLVTRILSTDPIIPNSTISPRMIAEEGWNVGGDTSIVRRSLTSFLDETYKGVKTGNVAAATRRVNQIGKFFEDGLFDGVYRESQLYALENFIVPALKRNHPTWNDRQLAGSAAEEVNKMFSTLGDWQTVFSSPATKELTRALIFSTNETESWIRMAVSGLHGENKRLWQEYGLGMLVFLGLTANLIHVVSTAIRDGKPEPLPLDRYTPITTNDPYGNVFGLGYNTKFLSPDLPFLGRNGTRLGLDIVGQADTAFRWILDPPGALTSRYNVLPRAIMNQATGDDFYGRSIESGPGGIPGRIGQFLSDMYMPIGAGNVAEIGRQLSPEVAGAIPEGEGRLGVSGSAAQITGVNVRAETTADLLNRLTEEGDYYSSAGKRITKYADLEPHQKKSFDDNQQVQAELELRGKTAVVRGNERAQLTQTLEQIDSDRYSQEEALVGEFQAKQINGEAFRDRYGDIQGESAVQKARLDDAFQIFKKTGEMPSDPLQRALTEYYQAHDDARTPSGRYDFEKAQSNMDRLNGSWTPEQKAYVERNTGLTKHPPEIQKFLKDQETLKPYWELRDKVAAEFPLFAQAKDAYEKLPPGDPGRKKYATKTRYFDNILERKRDTMRYANRGNNDVEKALMTWYRDRYTPIQIKKAKAAAASRPGPKPPTPPRPPRVPAGAR